MLMYDGFWESNAFIKVSRASGMTIKWNLFQLYRLIFW